MTRILRKLLHLSYLGFSLALVIVLFGNLPVGTAHAQGIGPDEGDFREKYESQEKELDWPEIDLLGGVSGYGSALLHMRNWPMKEGRRNWLFISSKGNFYLIEMENFDVETIDIFLGEFDAYRSEPVSSFLESRLFIKCGKLSIWIFESKERLLLRIDVKNGYGKASLRLQRYSLSEPHLTTMEVKD